MLKEDASFSSPISSLFYEYYEDIDSLKTQLSQNKDKIQCISSNINKLDAVPLGKTQKPQLWDYADNVDTVHFLLNI